MKTYAGDIIGCTDDTVTIRLPCDVMREILQKDAKQAEVRIQDGREISVDQRKKIHATIRDICEWMGEFTGLEYVKALMKIDFCVDYDIPWFSTADCDMTTAREFLNHLIDFCLRWGVPTSEPLNERTEDIGRYIYTCIENRICAITGEPNAEIHHYDRIGMGANRDKMCHIGMRVIPLRRDWHTRVHQENENKIYADHHIYPIALDQYLVKKLKIGKVEIN